MRALQALLSCGGGVTLLLLLLLRPAAAPSDALADFSSVFSTAWAERQRDLYTVRGEEQEGAVIDEIDEARGFDKGGRVVPVAIMIDYPCAH